MNKLAIIITHPIQYYAPVFKLLSERKKIAIKVFYTYSQAKEKIWDKNFGKEIKWDIPLLEGYDYTFVGNISIRPGIHHFFGLINPSLIKDIEEWHPSAILVFGWNYYSHFKAMRYFKGRIPVYFRGDSTLLDEQPGIKKIIRKLFLTRIYKNIDYAFYVGSNNKQYYLAHGIKEQQLIFAPHAVDNNRFFDANGEFEKKANEWRNMFGINDDNLVVLYAGKFETKKNPDLIINAVIELNKNKETENRKSEIIQLIMVGNGILETRLKEMAKDKKYIHFLPFQNQSIMPAIYRISDIFCLPSTGPGETWGLAVNEAMACSRPVIVSDKVGCAIDLVKNKGTGFIFKNNDCNELINILYFVEQNRQSLKEMGIKAHRHIKGFSLLDLVQSIERELI
jgi:glycosyltransferase involved in cell wall biosynthesis